MTDMLLYHSIFKFVFRCPYPFLVALSRRDIWAFDPLSFAFFDLSIQQIFNRMILLSLPF